MMKTIRFAGILAVLVYSSLALAEAPEKGKATASPPTSAVKKGGWDQAGPHGARPSRLHRSDGDRRAARPSDGEPEPFPVSNKAQQNKRASRHLQAQDKLGNKKAGTNPDGKNVKKVGLHPKSSIVHSAH